MKSQIPPSRLNDPSLTPMFRKVLHSKLHMARVTAAKPDYVGSITIDADLLDACGMRVNDAVEIANCRNGERFETYIFRGKQGSGCVELNGAAAHLVEIGDQLIIMHYAYLTDDQYAKNRPTVLIMGDKNRVLNTMHYEPYVGSTQPPPKLRKASAGPTKKKAPKR